MIGTTWNNNYFKYTFWSLILADILFFYAHYFPKFETIFFIITIIFFLFLMFRKIEFAIYLPILELLIGSQGHLMNFHVGQQIISFRIALFLISSTAGLYYTIKSNLTKKNKELLFLKSKYYKIFILFLLMLLWGTIIALSKHRSLNNIFLDLNGYLFILILPIFYQIIREKHLTKNLLYLFWGASFFFSLKVILSFYIFSHHFNGVNLTILYEWLRDTRVGEITMVNKHFFRIFFQSQIYILISFIINFNLLNFKKHFVEKNDFRALVVLTILNLSALIVSLSRSYWVGLTMFLFILFIWLIVKKYSFLKIIKVYLKFIAFLSVSILFVFLLVKIPHTNTDLSDIFSKRLTSNEDASNSRLELLPHMLNKIKKHSLIGNGLAQEITYFSYDPRNRNEKNPDGSVTTYSFEWGWLSIWMKFGILGIILYLYLILKIIIDSVKLATKNWPHSSAILFISLGLGMISISTIHIFSPYLDHPLGIGFIIISISLIEKEKYSDKFLGSK